MSYADRLKFLESQKAQQQKNLSEKPNIDTDNTDKSQSKAASNCPECHGSNLVTDSLGKYCVDCRRRPWEREPVKPAQTPTHIKVTWGEPTYEDGKKVSWLKLTNPVTGEATEIPAKSTPRWIFDRLNQQKGVNQCQEG